MINVKRLKEICEYIEKQHGSSVYIEIQNIVDEYEFSTGVTSHFIVKVYDSDKQNVGSYLLGYLKDENNTIFE